MKTKLTYLILGILIGGLVGHFVFKDSKNSEIEQAETEKDYHFIMGSGRNEAHYKKKDIRATDTVRLPKEAIGRTLTLYRIKHGNKEAVFSDIVQTKKKEIVPLPSYTFDYSSVSKLRKPKKTFHNIFMRRGNIIDRRKIISIPNFPSEGMSLARVYSHLWLPLHDEQMIIHHIQCSNFEKMSPDQTFHSNFYDPSPTVESFVRQSELPISEHCEFYLLVLEAAK